MSDILETEYNLRDRSNWGTGPWDGEPDKLSWKDGATALDCLIVRNHFGSLCGYVGVPQGHPFYGVHYAKVYQSLPDGVHGGLTYSDNCFGDICHRADDGDVGGASVWWLGFDCAHYQDFSPGLYATVRGLSSDPAMEILWHGKSYKAVGYVTEEVTRLAAQLRQLSVAGQCLPLPAGESPPRAPQACS